MSKKTYEDLMGALGRAVYFRPERRRARDIFSRNAGAAVAIGDETYALFDLSLNGLSFTCVTVPASWQPGKEISLAVVVRGQSAYRGRARIARVEPTGAGARVAVALTDGFVDVTRVLELDEDGQLDDDLGAGPEPVRARIPASYREAVERAVHLAQYYRRALARHEARQRHKGREGLERLEALTVRAADALRPRWRELEHAASRAALPLLADPAALRAAKEYTETMLTPLLIEAPMIRRSYTKPLGYPGDYQVMMYYYDNAFEGDSTFARVFHKFFVEHPLSNGVRTRKDLVRDLITSEQERFAELGGDQAHYRVTSLGCGPAREVAEYVARAAGWRGHITWTLIDQEEETLSVAFHDVHRHLARSASRGHISCLNLSFSQILQDPSVLDATEPQHLIFATGLFDYLREPRAQALLAALYQRLAPGGLVAIGNAKSPNLHFWSPEMILDWSLLYRTDEEMRRLGARLPEGAEIEVVLEPGEAYYFLLARKPA
jgi:extracellular factor (EF) 3-hydroxypalmitic acid methyl ester biosynthesis protein